MFKTLVGNLIFKIQHIVSFKRLFKFSSNMTNKVSCHMYFSNSFVPLMLLHGLVHIENFMI
jgi:hypothetical protein